MTKILFIITQAELGGAQRWVFDVATHLDKNRYQVIVAAGESKMGQIGLISRIGPMGIPTHELRHLVRNINPLKDLLAIWEMYRLIKKEQPDILQLCSTKAGFNGAIAGKLAGVPKIIYRIGGWSFNDPRPVWQNKIFFWLEKLSAPLKDKIIVNSQRDFDQALQLKICPKEKLHLLYNGIDNSFILRSQDKRTGRGEIVIGCIANFYPTKGLEYLIEAAYILNFKFKILNFKLIIVGDGQERPLLESLIKRYELENFVFLVGQKEKPWDYLEKERVDIFVISSVKEGMPYVLLEAMNHGLPIVATIVGAIPEIIKNQESGLLVPAKNPLALAEAIRQLASSLELQEKLAHNARQTVKKFGLPKMMAEYERLAKTFILVV